jgi:hypothetical protein
MNPTNLVLHFSDFSTILYGFYKKQESYFTIGVTLLQRGPWKDFWLCNVAPGARWPARLAKFRRARRGSWLGKDGGGSRGALGFDLMGWTGGGGLRRAALAAPVSTGRRTASTGARLAWVHKGRLGQLLGELERWRKGSLRLVVGRNWGSPRQLSWASAGGGSTAVTALRAAGGAGDSL